MRRTTLLVLCALALAVIGTGLAWILQEPARPAQADPAVSPEQAAPPDSQTPLVRHWTAAPDKPLNLLILGVDEEQARTDVMILAHWEPEHRLLNLISLPRDSRVPIPCPEELPYCLSPDKLNHAYAYGTVRGRGPELARATVEQWLGIRVDHHVVLDFDSFREAVDSLGGVTLTVEPGMEDVKLYPGTYRLDGKQALRYVRFRDERSGDIGRIRRTQRFLLAVLDAVRKKGSLSNFPHVIHYLLSLVQTDLTTGKALPLTLGLITGEHPQVRTVSLPGRELYQNDLWFWNVADADREAIVREYITHVKPPASRPE